MTIQMMPVIYLAGGMRSGWQDTVIAATPNAVFIDPRRHAKDLSEADYTAWDLTGVERADIVFGYIERDNPSGAGLALEMGYGAKAGKRLIYVEDTDFPYTRYFGMVRAVSHHVTHSLTDAINQLQHEIIHFRRQQV